MLQINFSILYESFVWYIHQNVVVINFIGSRGAFEIACICEGSVNDLLEFPGLEFLFAIEI